MCPKTGLLHQEKGEVLWCTQVAGWLSAFFTVQLSHPYMTTGKNSFSSKEQASFNCMAAVTVCCDFGVQENKVCHCFHCFLTYLPWSDGTGCHDISFLWKSQLFHSPLYFHQRLFSSSLSAIRMVSSAYLRLLIFLPAILIPACASSSPAFRMMYSAYNLNKLSLAL